jgi:hypothetical protein
MTHKEFTIWLEGFLTNRDWTTIKEGDIIAIKERLKEVNRKELPDFSKPPIPYKSPYGVGDVLGDVPYYTLCSCNPVNGGSGICGCTMGNQMVSRDYLKQNNFTTELDRLTNIQMDMK